MPATKPPVSTITKTSATSANAQRRAARCAATCSRRALRIRRARARPRTSPRRSRARAPRCAVSRNCDTRGSSTRPLCTMYQPIAPCSAAQHEDAGELATRSRGGICAARGEPERAARGTRRRSARPSSRWTYSHQKMPLNSASVIPWLTWRYSGVSLVLRERLLPLGVGRAAAACRRSAATRRSTARNA